MMDKRGFTLIEVLLAGALTAIVLTSLYSSFFVIERAVSASEGTLLTLHEARTALEVIRTEIEASFKVSGSNASSESEFKVVDRDFYGKNASRVSFSTHSSIVYGPARVTYRVEEIREKLVLIKSISTVSSNHTDAPEAEMVEEIESFLIEARQKNGQWENSWSGAKLPFEVRISIEVPLEVRTLQLSTIARIRQGNTL
jgi:prepilin-type N-terminal cleavage/methylation domain-containing protein